MQKEEESEPDEVGTPNSDDEVPIRKPKKKKKKKGKTDWGFDCEFIISIFRVKQLIKDKLEKVKMRHLVKLILVDEFATIFLLNSVKSISYI